MYLMASNQSLTALVNHSADVAILKNKHSDIN